MKNKTVTGRELKDGQVVWIQGHTFKVSEVGIEKAPDGKEVVRFIGTATPEDHNNSIRHTSYNGGRYGQLADMPYTLRESNSDMAKRHRADRDAREAAGKSLNEFGGGL